VVFDPQFYATMITPARDGKLPDYTQYYRPNLTRHDFMSAANIQRYAQETLDFQYGLNLTGIYSPTIEVLGMSDVTSQIAMQLAEASVEHHSASGDNRPLSLSFLFGAAALDNMDDLEAFLDNITLLDGAGFYVMVNRGPESYTQGFSDVRLAHWMYLVYTLGVINKFSVTCGYSDLVSLALTAAGASKVATGWHHGLRQFSFRRFRPSSGGGPARPRYTSGPVLNSILASELDQAIDADVDDELRSGTDYDDEFSIDNWPPLEQVLHHWQTIAELVEDLEPMTVDDATNRLIDLCDEAEGHRPAATMAGVEFETSFDHLDQWRNAIDLFRDTVGL
ncbi:MAG: hypothetical protein AAFO75_11135, partial [Pseudomonadota bacterium]